MPSDSLALDLLHLAAAAPIGVVISVSDLALAKSRLYAARTGHPELSGLQLRTSPHHPETELWIVREQASLGPPAGPGLGLDALLPSS